MAACDWGNTESEVERVASAGLPIGITESSAVSDVSRSSQQGGVIVDMARTQVVSEERSYLADSFRDEVPTIA